MQPFTSDARVLPSAPPENDLPILLSAGSCGRRLDQSHSSSHRTLWFHTSLRRESGCVREATEAVTWPAWLALSPQDQHPQELGVPARKPLSRERTYWPSPPARERKPGSLKWARFWGPGRDTSGTWCFTVLLPCKADTPPKTLFFRAQVPCRESELPRLGEGLEGCPRPASVFEVTLRQEVPKSDWLTTTKVYFSR